VRKLYIAGAILLSAAAFYLSTGLREFWPLAWIAPLPVLLVAFRSSAPLAAGIAFTAFLLGSSNMFSYLWMLMPPVAVAVSVIVPALAFAVAVLAARRAVRNTKPWVAVFAFPAAWTCWEWLVSVVSPHGSAGSLAYSQTDALPLIQIASIAGLLGVTFVLMLASSGLAVAWHSRKLSPLAASFSIVLAALIYGSVRLAQPATQASICVGMAVTDTTVKYFDTDKPEEALPVVQAYARRVAELARRGAKIIVLPEKFVGVTPAYDSEVRRILAGAAQANGVIVVAGLNEIKQTPRRNLALVFSPDGSELAQYDKVHYIPVVEAGYRMGVKPSYFPVSGVQCAVAICKDMDFAEWLRRYAQGGARFLFVPAWDFVRDARLHDRMAVMRGVEGGFALVRSAQQGLLTVSDHCGRMLAEVSTSSGPEALLVADVRPGPGPTFYSAAGNWLGWVCLALLVASLIAI
jgi:apolipoprotein N-acyltransferase